MTRTFVLDVTVHQILTSELYMLIAVKIQGPSFHSIPKNPWTKLGTWTTFQL